MTNNKKRFTEYTTKYTLIQAVDTKNGNKVVLFDLGNEFVVWSYFEATDCFLSGDYSRKGADSWAAMSNAIKDLHARVKRYGGAL